MNGNTLLVPPNLSGEGALGWFTSRDPVSSEIPAAPFRTAATGVSVYLPVQKHTDIVLSVTEDSPGEQVADAVITRNIGLLIGVRVADCVPLLLHDPCAGVIGAVHAGWRGTAKSILKKTIGRMSKEFCSRPENLRMAIGPCIRACCYNVGPDVFEEVSGSVGGGHLARDGEDRAGWRLDLALINRIQAQEAGLNKVNIWDSGICTFCRSDFYHSFRREGASAGRQGGFIVREPLCPEGAD